MPEMDGYQATTIIRDAEVKSGKHTRIVSISANPLKEQSDLYPAGGMDGHLPKPFEAKLLENVISRFFPDAEEKTRNQAPPDNPAAESEQERSFDYASALERAGGSKERLRMIADLFMEQAPKLLDQIHLHIAACYRQSFIRSAHTFKGSVSNFNAPDAVEEAQRLEKAGCEENFGEASSALQKLKTQVARLQTDLADVTR